MTEIERTDPVVAGAAKIKKRAGIDVLRVADSSNFLHGVSGDDRATDNQVLDSVGIADCRRDAAREVAPSQAVRARHAADFVLDDGAVLDFHVSVRHVDAPAAPVARRQQERWQARRRLGEISRDRGVRQFEALLLADAAAVRVHAGAVGEQSADAVAADRRLVDGRCRPGVPGATDGVHAATRGTAAKHRVAAHDASLHDHEVCIDCATECAAIPRRFEVAGHVVVVEIAVREAGRAPHRDSSPTCQRPGLRVCSGDRGRVSHAAAARDRDIRERKIAVDGQYARAGLRTADPCERDAPRKTGSIDDDILSRFQRRSTVIPIEIADQIRDGAAGLVTNAHHLALQQRVFVCDDRQRDRASVKCGIESDRLP